MNSIGEDDDSLCQSFINCIINSPSTKITFDPFHSPPSEVIKILVLGPGKVVVFFLIDFYRC